MNEELLNIHKKGVPSCETTFVFLTTTFHHFASTHIGQ